ncbi:MAG: hypothetical protein RJQ04_07570 [Longimicrobiales bacterium]
MRDTEADEPETTAGPGAGAYEARFDEDQVRRIFDLATREGEEQARGNAGGLTLTQLQSIGRDVGLAEEAVARAAMFAARGHTESHGSLRQWTNGNLQILLEPTDAGYQIRMRTKSANIEGLLAGGLASAVSGALIALLAAIVAKPGAWAVAGLGGMLIVLGVLMGAFAGVLGSAWADTREDQFKRVAARAAELAERETDSQAG